jgi:5'-3' exonuclease
MIKVLLIDGEWNLRRNANKRQDMRSGGEWCGGSFGFIDSLRSIVKKIMPDRVVVFWDGKAAGIYRKEIYPLYKSNRGRDFSRESYGFTERGIAYEQNKKNSLLKQKIKVKNYLEELYIRQAEVPYIEADDLIAGYVKNRKDDDVIYIFSSDKDYYSLLDTNVNVIRPSDMLVINKDNFESNFGYHYENAILVKCFEGDDSDVIEGIKGVGLETMLNFFPDIKHKKLNIDDLISMSETMLKNKKSKKLETITECKEKFELNKKLMDLNEYPFLTQEAVDAINDVTDNLIVDPKNSRERSVENAMKMFVRDGYHQFLFNESYELFFQPFYRISVKELEYSKSFLT